MTGETLHDLVRDNLQAKHDNSPPCLHRYRGIVREREIVRRAKREDSALAALWAAVKPSSWSGLCPAGTHGLDFEGQTCDLCTRDT